MNSLRSPPSISHDHLVQSWDAAVQLLKNAGVSISSIDLVKAVAQLDVAVAGLTPSDVSTRVIVGAQCAYACIAGNPFSLDVQLQPGMAAPTSLRNSSLENQQQAKHLIRQAMRMEYAVTILALQDKKPVAAAA
ncbi:hypothetical protein [Pseudoduganella sp. R-34]|uniref:hypothetical protein n=1 Tax=Pseudoduganella sp. R-34 TaxID=3404062 RepID=UPI003CF88EC3